MNNTHALLLALFFALITGCDTKVCDDSTVDKRASFILECIKNANPKSDEEPKGWIRQCQFMATDTYCEVFNENL